MTLILAPNPAASALLRVRQSNAWKDITAPASEIAALMAADARRAAEARGHWYVLGASAVAVSHTGNTNETALATVALPAGSMGANGLLRVTSLFTVTNSANNKTLRTRLGGISGTAFQSLTLTTNETNMSQRLIQNRNSQSSQVGSAAAVGGSFGNSSNSVVTGAIDTASAQDVVISGQLANSGETITLQSYLIELCYRA